MLEIIQGISLVVVNTSRFRDDVLRYVIWTYADP